MSDPITIDAMQENILTGIFGSRDSKLFTTTLNSDIKHWTKPSFNFLWKKAIATYKKTDEVITWDILKRELSKTAFIEDKMKELYIVELKKIFNKKKAKRLKRAGLLKYTISELNAIQRNAEFFNLAKEHAVLINSGKVDDIDEQLDKTIAELVNRLSNKKMPDYTIIDFSNSFENRMKERREERENISSYKKFHYRYKSLNAIFPKGHRGGDVILLSGITGVGKSISAIDIAGQCGEQNLNVVVITSENTIHQTCGRLDSNLTGYEYDIIQAYGFNDTSELQKFEKTFNKKLDVAEHIKVIKMSPNNFSILTIMRALNELKKKKFVPDVLIIDSPDLMRPSVEMKYGGENFTRITKSIIYWEIKGCAIDNNLIIFCTSQLTRDAGKKKDPLTASAEDIADSYDKVRICDAMLILLETIELALDNKIAIKIGKNRDGTKPIEPVILCADKARMRFYDEAGYVDFKQYKEERNKIKRIIPQRNAA